jgi:hypothetical protein
VVREPVGQPAIGGDEFFVLLPGCPESEAMEAGERTLDAVPLDQRFSLGVVCRDGEESGRRWSPAPTAPSTTPRRRAGPGWR